MLAFLNLGITYHFIDYKLVVQEQPRLKPYLQAIAIMYMKSPYYTLTTACSCAKHHKMKGNKVVPQI